MKRNFQSRLIRWAIFLIAVIIIIIALQITVLAYPQMLVSKNIQRGSISIFYDGNNDAYISEIADDVHRRLLESQFYDSTQNINVYLLRNQKLYNIFAALSMLPNSPQGFALSIFDNAFVDETRVNELAEISGGYPQYGIYEGLPGHTIAHEVGHLYISARIGRSTWKRLPLWKQEGFPEYIANISLIRADSMANLQKRTAILNDDSAWRDKRSWDRIHYEAGLLVEYLLDVRGYSIEEIIADSVTLDAVRSELLEWCRMQESKR